MCNSSSILTFLCHITICQISIPPDSRKLWSVVLVCSFLMLHKTQIVVTFCARWFDKCAFAAPDTCSQPWLACLIRPVAPPHRLLKPSVRVLIPWVRMWCFKPNFIFLLLIPRRMPDGKMQGYVLGLRAHTHTHVLFLRVWTHRVIQCDGRFY